nr:M20/M25/M40 family metallo-hydrolase [Lysobacter sp. CFH 32150]
MATQLLVAHPIDNQATVGGWLPQVQEANIRATIHHLSTAYPNRYYASSYGLAAATWIRDTWLALGNGRADVSAELYTGCTNCSTQPSVILTIQGSELPDEIVVLGGHLDSISNSGTGNAMNAPGADDDASGIATLTEVIRIALGSGWKPKRTVKFMGYAAEEVGLRGSHAIAQSFRNQNKNVVGVLQLDMTNYAAGSTVAMRLITDYSNPGMQQFTTDVFDAYLAPTGLTRGTYTCGYGCSDHASWTNAGYPSAMMFEPTFFTYLHTTFDTLPQMGGTAASSVNFARLGLAFLGELAKTSSTVRSDFNGDGNSDILWRHATSGANTIWLSANANTRQLMSKVGDLAWKIAGTGDFNGDNKVDILWRNTNTGANMIWRSGSAATQQATSAANVAWQVAAVDDFDGDSHADILWRHGSTGANTIWWSANASTVQALTKVADLDWKVAGAGDVDGDGRADIVWRNGRTGSNAIWRSGNAANYQAMTSVTNLAWRIVGIGDINADGRDDVVWRNSATGANVIWRSANAATVQSMTGVTNLAWHIVGIGDYDGDGHSDVLWRDTTVAGGNTIWKSANHTTQQAVASVADLSWEVSR